MMLSHIGEHARCVGKIEEEPNTTSARSKMRDQPVRGAFQGLALLSVPRDPHGVLLKVVQQFCTRRAPARKHSLTKIVTHPVREIKVDAKNFSRHKDEQDNEQTTLRTPL
jgi:hypothetical protein